MKVLILGAAARLGPYVIVRLADEHTLRVTDIVAGGHFRMSTCA